MMKDVSMYSLLYTNFAATSLFDILSWKVSHHTVGIHGFVRSISVV
jgi:hypothetical protein